MNFVVPQTTAKRLSNSTKKPNHLKIYTQYTLQVFIPKLIQFSIAININQCIYNIYQYVSEQSCAFWSISQSLLGLLDSNLHKLCAFGVHYLITVIDSNSTKMCQATVQHLPGLKCCFRDSYVFSLISIFL